MPKFPAVSGAKKITDVKLILVSHCGVRGVEKIDEHYRKYIALSISKKTATGT